MTMAADSNIESLCFGHVNIRSLINKTLPIEELLKDINVLALTETHLKPNVENDAIKIDNFKLYRKDRNSRGGGVGLYIQKDFTVFQRSDFDQKELEMIWVEIWLRDIKPFLVGCCYRSPSSKIEYFHKMCRAIEMTSNEDKDIFLLGDFNIDWSVKNNEEEMKKNAEEEKKEKEEEKKKEEEEKKEEKKRKKNMNKKDEEEEKKKKEQEEEEEEKEEEEQEKDVVKILQDLRTRFDFVSSLCGLTQIINEATRVKKETSTCIDHIYTNISVVPKTKDLDESHSDHKLITCTVEKRKLRRRNTETDPSVTSEFPLIKYIMNEKPCATTFKSVEEELKSLLPFSCGTDEVQSSTSAVICDILNSWIKRGEFPSERHENFIYRQILEEVVLRQMEKHFNTLKDDQLKLADITDQWIKDVKNSQEVGIVFMDFSFPADVISPDLLLPKLRSYGFLDLHISMIRSFLSDRNSSSCCRTDAHCELPQGRCMTHFLFSVYTNDLKVCLKQKQLDVPIVLSGSKLMMYHSADYKGLKTALRMASENVHCWLRENRMVLKTFTSARIRSKNQVTEIRRRLKSTRKLDVEEFNWIRVLGILLHDAPHLVWTFK